MLLFNTPSVIAQTGVSLAWSSEVGCLEYNYDDKRQVPVENLPEYGGGTIKLYSLDGTLLADQKVTEEQGRVHFDLNGLASGTYVVVFFSEGRRIGQQTFIKE